MLIHSYYTKYAQGFVQGPVYTFIDSPKTRLALEILNTMLGGRTELMILLDQAGYQFTEKCEKLKQHLSLLNVKRVSVIDKAFFVSTHLPLLVTLDLELYLQMLQEPLRASANIKIGKGFRYAGEPLLKEGSSKDKRNLTALAVYNNTGTALTNNAKKWHTELSTPVPVSYYGETSVLKSLHTLFVENAVVSIEDINVLMLKNRYNKVESQILAQFILEHDVQIVSELIRKMEEVVYG